jgi:uncharacterized protein (TIGR02147 family)
MARRQLQTFAQELPVTTYLDYRDYLGDLYQKAKAVTSPYSYLAFAEDLGFSATNVIRLVLARKRTLAVKSARTIVQALELRNEQRKYFLAMVKYVNARSAGLRSRHFQEMLHVKQESVVSEKDKERMRYYGDWFHPVVRETVRLEGFVPDAAWVASRLYAPLAAEKVEQSLLLLESLGLIARDAVTGGIRLTETSPMLLPSDATAGELSIKQYHQSMIDLARQAVNDVPSQRREMNALTLCLSLERFKELRKRLREFCAEVLATEGEDQRRDCVAQLNLQLFTLTRPPELNDEER